MVSQVAAGVIPKESLSAYQRWELASLAPEAGAPPRAAASDVGALQDARAEELAMLRAAAVAEGRAEGLAAAAADAARLAALLAALGSGLRDSEQKIADGVLDLALVLARQLAGDALAVRRDLIMRAIEGALAQMPEAQRVRLHLAPADVDLVRSLLEAHPAVETCQLVSDAGVAAGGFKIESELCEVDATLAQRWKRLAASLGRSYDWLEHR